MSDAFLPSTRSALRPSATPVAFVVNGLVESPPLPTSNVPPTTPAVAYSKARPLARLLTRRHGLLPFGVPPSPERQPEMGPPPVAGLFDWRGGGARGVWGGWG